MPKGMPDKPHPRQPSGLELDEPIEINDNPLLDDLKEDLIDIKKDVDLNYRRLTYGNPVVNHMLKMVGAMLGTIIEYLDFEDVDTEIKGMHKERKNASKSNEKITFGMTKDDI